MGRKKMKEKPILLNSAMVRAILEGRKTQTRRVVKHPTIGNVVRVNSYKNQSEFDLIMEDDSGTIVCCPYGQPGDRLWVRETTIISPPNWNDGSDCNVKDDQGRKRIVQWVASSPRTEGAEFYNLKKTPSIHMPRWASRITLEVVNVRVERVQDISYAEGVRRCEGDCLDHFMGFKRGNPVRAFEMGWDAINAKRGDSWESNPWVWVVEFREIEP